MTRNSSNKEGIYIELDCLLDTRIATIAKIDQELAIKVLQGDYHHRKNDEFPGVDLTLFAELYKKRDVTTLQMSAPTGLSTILNDIIRKIVDKTIDEPYFQDVKIVVNTYPYALSKEEVDAMQNAVQQWIKFRCDVEIKYIRPDDLTPSYVKKHFAMLVMYDYNSWLNRHAAGFEYVLLNDVILFGPSIYFNTMPTDSELHEMRESNMHPFQAMEMLAAPIIGLQLIDIKYYSLLRPQ